MPRITDFAGRVVLVTGGSSGIGAALARDLAARGATVALLARGGERLDAEAARIARAGGRATAHPCDVSDPEALRRTIDAVAGAHGRLDGVVASAGIGAHGLFRDATRATLDAILRINVQGLVHTVHFALPHLLARGEGFLVNVSSVAGRIGQPDEAVYSASKFAVTGLSEGLAIELAPFGIHVLAVYPGLVRTALFTEAELARLPDGVRRGAIEAEDVSRATLRALAKGHHEVTVPKLAVGGYLLRTLAPPLFRRILARIRLPALPDLRPPER